jgi:hypothetical protein
LKQSPQVPWCKGLCCTMVQKCFLIRVPHSDLGSHGVELLFHLVDGESQKGLIVVPSLCKENRLNSCGTGAQGCLTRYTKMIWLVTKNYYVVAEHILRDIVEKSFVAIAYSSRVLVCVTVVSTNLTRFTPRRRLKGSWSTLNAAVCCDSSPSSIAKTRRDTCLLCVGVPRVAWAWRALTRVEAGSVCSCGTRRARSIQGGIGIRQVGAKRRPFNDIPGQTDAILHTARPVCRYALRGVVFEGKTLLETVGEELVSNGGTCQGVQEKDFGPGIGASVK